MITRRCVQRQFLLRPDRETNNAFTYCLAEAAERFQMEVVLPVAMSNHHHTIIYDRHGRYPEFLEHFHKMLARCMNVYRGRKENFWSSDQVCVVHLVETKDVIAKLVYVATNPVNSHLVERAFQWPGVNGYRALRTDTPLEATRPNFFFRKHGTMPERITLRLTVPIELGHSREQLVAILDERIRAAEADAQATRRTSQRSVVGRRSIRRQSWTTRPLTSERPPSLRPRVAAQDKAARIDALQRLSDFRRSYRDARTALLAGAAATFPSGTYWLRRFARVPVAAA